MTEYVIWGEIKNKIVKSACHIVLRTIVHINANLALTLHLEKNVKCS